MFKYLKLSGLFALFVLVFAGRVSAMDFSNLTHYSNYNRQRIHKLTINTAVVYKLNTAGGYVSVITLPVIPLSVSVGNSSAYQTQVLGNRIFVKPISYGKKVSTNLEILTKFGMLNVLLVMSNKKDVTYDLDLANPSGEMFYKNYMEHKLSILETKLKEQYAAKYRSISAIKKRVAENKLYVEKLILSINKQKANISANKKNVSFTVLYKSRIGHKHYIRYMISNSTNNYVILHSLYLYDSNSSWYGASSKKEARILNSPSSLKLMPRELYKGIIVYNDKNANEISAHFYINGKLVIIKVKL